MKIRNIFVVTPLGEDGSKERIHADRMKGSVFHEFESYSFKSSIDERGGSAVVAERIFNQINEADVVVADMTFGNLNVFYEIGIAHALNKSVILIGPKEFNVPFDLNHLSRIQYDKDLFDSERNSHIVDQLKKDIGKELQNLETSDKNGLNPYEGFLKETTKGMLSDIHSKIKNLEDMIARTQNKDVVVTEYIKGENNAFAALTEAVKKATKSIRTTRFSPYSVVGRQNVFYETIRHIMDNKNNRDCPDDFQRIIATNKKDKLNEVLDLVRSNMGCNFTIHLSQQAYNFEIVIVDELIVFIHFCKDREDVREIISATLKVENFGVAIEFRDIFDSIVKYQDTFYTIKCIDINDDNLAEKIAKIREEFEKGLKRFEKNSEKNISKV